MATVTGTGQWYKSGQGLVAVRWVFVQDRSGSHRDEYCFTTEVGRSVPEVIETYVGRWNEETDRPHYTSSGRWCGPPAVGYDRHLRAA